MADTAWSPVDDGFALEDLLDNSRVEGLRREVARLVVAPRFLRIACDRITGIDPVGAALLWLFCRNLETSAGTRIRLTGLRDDLVHKLHSHPLREFLALGEELFSDPFGSRPPSER